MKKVFFALLLLFLCTGSAFSAVAVQEVTLDHDALCLAAGSSKLLIVTVLPVNANNKVVTWTSSNPSVASVNGNGKIVANSQGYAIITATTQDRGYTAGCIVYVDPFPQVEGVVLNQGSLLLQPGQKGRLFSTVSPGDAAVKHVTWESSNPSIATVSKTGEVLAEKPGTATIIVTTVDGEKKAQCIISVDQASVPVTGVSLNPKALTLNVGQISILKADVTPADATGKHLTWKSSDPLVASVSNTGEVRAHAPGNAKITVSTVESVTGSLTDYCDVFVDASPVRVAGVRLNQQAVSLSIGGKSSLIAQVTPQDATGKRVTWSSSNSLIATVNITGVVSALTEGLARITVTTVDGGFTDFCDIEVLKPTIPVTGVTLDKPSIEMFVGKTEKITATVSPMNANNRTFTWFSSNDSVATVSAGGIVTGIATGTATIAAIAAENSFSAFSNVTVLADTGGATEGCSVMAMSPLKIVLVAPLLLLFFKRE